MKRIAAFLLSGALCAGLLSGCGSTSSSASTSNADVPESQPVSISEAPAVTAAPDSTPDDSIASNSASEALDVPSPLAQEVFGDAEPEA